MNKAYRAFEKSGKALLQAIAIYLGLDEHYFDDYIHNGNSILRAIHYPPITSEPKSAIRAEQHEHHFKTVENGTLLIDLFDFEAPYGNLGKLFSKLYLTKYLRRLLEQRNNVIREYAESDKWKFILNR